MEHSPGYTEGVVAHQTGSPPDKLMARLCLPDIGNASGLPEENTTHSEVRATCKNASENSIA